MNPLLQPEIQQFIDRHIGADPSRLALQKNPFPNADWIAIVNQIAAKTKAKDKLPTWFAAADIIYPARISVEQTSSEKTAQYKSQLVGGASLIDLTGGFGVDDYYFSKAVDRVVHCEINPELSAIAAHNFKQLAANAIECLSGDSTGILQNSGKFDWIYIDPSRRNDVKGKVFMLKDCQPNVPELLDLYFMHAGNILIKTAPILDIAAGLNELKNVKAIHIVAVDNEVKELLWVLSNDYAGEIGIKTANIAKTSVETFDFVLDTASDVKFGPAQKYLYEPNAAVMKSGGFEAVSHQFGLDKLHPHSHLYTSDALIDFPGRIFEISQIVDYNKNEMKALQGKKANVTVRNFPESVENIRKKWKINDGGTTYCFFTTDANNRKIALICTKIK